MTNKVELHGNAHTISKQSVIIVRVEDKIPNLAPELEKQRKPEYSTEIRILKGALDKYIPILNYQLILLLMRFHFM